MLDKAIYLHQLKKIERKLNRFDIQIIHFIPGRIRLKSIRWMNDEALLEVLKNRIKQEPIINSVDYNTVSGSMVIEYSKEVNIPLCSINRWIEEMPDMMCYKKLI